jgi:transcriptional regulator with XRE-family HTH domain
VRHHRSVQKAIFDIAGAVRELRTALGWSQAELARRAGASQSVVSRIESGKLAGLSFAAATRLLEAMGGRLLVDVDRPYLGQRRLQRDAAHVRCVGHVARRLERAGWYVAREVEVGGDRSRGWIDVLAFHPRSRLVLVIEVKTELHDLGQVERQLGWYEREAWLPHGGCTGDPNASSGRCCCSLPRRPTSGFGPTANLSPRVSRYGPRASRRSSTLDRQRRGRGLSP